MPVVLRIRGFKFYFYANEGDEPPHIHVDKGGATAKLTFLRLMCSTDSELEQSVTQFPSAKHLLLRQFV
jgi:hypothetical protein